MNKWTNKWIEIITKDREIPIEINFQEITWDSNNQWIKTKWTINKLEINNNTWTCNKTKECLRLHNLLWLHLCPRSPKYNHQSIHKWWVSLKDICFKHKNFCQLFLKKIHTWKIKSDNAFSSILSEFVDKKEHQKLLVCWSNYQFNK